MEAKICLKTEKCLWVTVPTVLMLYRWRFPLLAFKVWDALPGSTVGLCASQEICPKCYGLIYVGYGIRGPCALAPRSKRIFLHLLWASTRGHVAMSSSLFVGFPYGPPNFSRFQILLDCPAYGGLGFCVIRWRARVPYTCFTNSPTFQWQGPQTDTADLMIVWWEVLIKVGPVVPMHHFKRRGWTRWWTMMVRWSIPISPRAIGASLWV